MTEIEKLTNVLRTLNSISIPMAFLQSIAIPLHNAAVDISDVIQSLEKGQFQNVASEIDIEAQDNNSEEVEENN